MKTTSAACSFVRSAKMLKFSTSSVSTMPSLFSKSLVIDSASSHSGTAAAAAPAVTPASSKASNKNSFSNELTESPGTRVTSPASGDYDTANPTGVRKLLHVHGLVPPAVETFEMQSRRCLALFEQKTTDLEKFSYLSQLRVANVHLFYRLLSENMSLLTPFIYTPTVGEACQKWSHIYTQPEGMYISYSDRGNIHAVLQNWPLKVDITVITDGSRILGLGDLGVNGMGIPVGKLALYTACAGVYPGRTLPLTVDFGTSNEQLRKDPLYLGSRIPKISEQEQIEFLDELMQALTERWPRIVIQFEDWKNPFPSLERYRSKYPMFNDDIQGTGSVITAGFINAVVKSGIAPKDHRAVFLGAGSAGVGVAKALVSHFVHEGLSEKESRCKFWLLDSKGLITLDRGDELADHKVYFARDDNNGKQYETLEEVIDYVKPTILIGLSTIGGAFSREILQRMGSLNEKPVIFPLSNPSSKSECTFEEAITATDGRCLFASGSPFAPIEYKGKTYHAGQGNNMYVFPGIGLGAILSEAENVTEQMIYAAATALASSVTDEENEAGLIYPKIDRIREVSVRVAVQVIRTAQKNKVDRKTFLREISNDELTEYTRAHMYDPFVQVEERRNQIVEIVRAHEALL